MKPKHSNPLLRSIVCVMTGAATLGSSAFAGDNLWNGSLSTNWNDDANWNLNRVPSKAIDFDNAIINSTSGFPVISANLAAIPNEIKVGTGGGNSGRVDHNAGSAIVGDGGWTAVGEFGGNGTYNLADTSASGGTLTGFGTGSGSYSTQRLYISREGNATSQMAVNTSGEVKVFNDMYIGQGGTGILKWDAGTLNRNGDGGWMVVGLDGGSNDGNGTFNINGGTINAANDTIVGLNSGSTGNLNHTGGTYNAGGIWAGRGGGTGTWAVSGVNTQLNSTGEVYVGAESGSNGTLQVNSGTVAVNNWVNVGRDGGTGNLQMSGGTMSVDRELRIGFGVSGVGTMAVSGGAQITAGLVSDHIVIGGNKGNGSATVTDVTGAGTKLSSVNELRVGNDAESVGQLTVSGGTAESGSWLGIGRNGSTGTLTINGTGVVNQGITDSGSRLELTNNGIPSTATLNLDGGTLSTNGIISGSSGTRNVFLNGGLLKPRIQNYTFLEGMSSVTVKAGGALIDTDSNDIKIGQSMIGDGLDGGLTKSGAGTLFLNGTNSYAGTTAVTGGELSGDGSVSGPLSVQVGAIFSPGYIYGDFGAGNTTITGTYAYDVDASDSDRLNVTGSLNLSAATDSLDFRERGDGATLPVYIIANYTSRTGTFDNVNGLPPGYTLNYGSIQMTITRPLTPFETWAQTFFPGETNQSIIGAEADPDGDGQQNNLEFALGGSPNSGANNAKIYQLTEDSSDAGSAKELLLTIAVRDGAGLDPVFAPATGGNPTATQDGVTYTIEGSADLAFTGAVSVVATVATGLPSAPSGYEYRTFSLDGSDGLPLKGFMRVKITP